MNYNGYDWENDRVMKWEKDREKDVNRYTELKLIKRNNSNVYVWCYWNGKTRLYIHTKLAGKGKNIIVIESNEERNILFQRIKWKVEQGYQYT